MNFLFLSIMLTVHSFLVDSDEALTTGLFHYHQELQSDYRAENARWQELNIDELVMYVAGGVNVRSIPDTSGEVIDYLENGTEVIITAAVYDSVLSDDKYYRIKSDRKSYVSSKFLVSIDPASDVKDVELFEDEIDEKITRLFSKEKGKEKTEGYRLNVELIYQSPELPQGCEITALTAAMNYTGYEVDKCDMADVYLPKSKDLSANPEEYYLRNPRTNGFYCFAPVLVKTIERYNQANKTDIIVDDLTGSEPTELYGYIDKGIPVVVWGTLRWNPPYRYDNGLYGNLHCMVLSGYTNNSVYITDSIYGDTKVSRSQFEKVWKQMGSRAVIVK